MLIHLCNVCEKKDALTKPEHSFTWKEPISDESILSSSDYLEMFAAQFRCTIRFYGINLPQKDTGTQWGKGGV